MWWIFRRCGTYAVSIQTAGVQITVRPVITVAQWEAHCGVADLLLSFCYYFGKKRIPL